jgi:hypothetical protein
MFKQPALLIVHRLINCVNSTLLRAATGIVLFAVNMASCENANNQQTPDYHISDGCYEGYFEYQNDYYRSSICFENGRYIERPSLVFPQKSLGCLTIGTYSTEAINLQFEAELLVFNDDLREPCVVDTYLPGNYIISISETNDSLIFSRGIGDNYIIYRLMRLCLDE